MLDIILYYKKVVYFECFYFIKNKNILELESRNWLNQRIRMS